MSLPSDVSAAWTQHYAAKRSDSGSTLLGEPTSPTSAAAQKVSVISKLQRRVARKTIHTTAAGEKHWNMLRKEAFKVGRRARRERLHKAWAKVHAVLEDALESTWFDHFIAIVVLLNGICIAAEVDSDSDNKAQLDRLEALFAMVFVLEAAANVMVYGFQHCLHNHKMEMGLAAVSIYDAASAMIPWIPDMSLSVFSMLRLARFTRFFKSGELAVISHCFFPAFKTLAHVSCFLLIIIFVFSVPAAHYIGKVGDTWEKNDMGYVNVLYGSIPRAIFGLLQMMINPDTALIRDVSEQMPWTGPFFVIFLGMTTYTTLAILTGSIVDSYNQKADEERLKQSRHQRMEHAQIRSRLLSQFKVADKQEAHLQGVLSSDNFKRCLNAKWCQIGLQELGLEDETCQNLILMLEIDGHVHYEEFIEALAHIGQPAQATDVLSLRAHVSEELSTVESIVTNVEKRLNTRLDSLEEKILTALARR